MGKHEKPVEKSFLDKACEVEDVMNELKKDDVLGFTSMGIQLSSTVFKANFTEYDTSVMPNGKLIFTEYNGHRFVAYDFEVEK